MAILTCDVRASVVNLSLQNFGKFTMQNFFDTHTNVVQVSYDGHVTVLRKHANTSQLSGERIKLRFIRTNVLRHSHKCVATVIRMKMKISYICRKVVKRYHEFPATVVRQLGDYSATVARYIFKIRPYSRICRINVHSLRLQCESCVYIVNICREIVANYSRTGLQKLKFHKNCTVFNSL